MMNKPAERLNYGAPVEPIQPSRARRRATLACLLGVAAACVWFGAKSLDTNGDGATEASEAADLGVYDAADMPDKLTAELQRVVSDDLASRRTLVVGDEKYRPLPSSQYDDAAFMYVEIGDGSSRDWRIYVDRGLDAAVNESTACKTKDRSTLSCVTSVSADGALIVEQTLAMRYNDDLQNWQLIDWQALDVSSLGGVRLERSWSVYRADGHKTAVIERVVSPKSLLPEEAFESTLEDWAPVLDNSSLGIGR